MGVSRKGIHLSATTKLVFWAAAIAACLPTAFGAVDASTDSNSVDAITTPSKEAVLSFVMPGRIDKILVKEGQQVKAGDVLAKQDATAEELNVAQLKIQADDNIQVDAAKAQLDQKRVDLKNLQIAHNKGTATDTEVDHAVLDVTMAELTVNKAQMEHVLNDLKYREMKAHVDRMTLHSSFDGKVEKIIAHEGEANDSNTKAMRIVSVDPLWIDVSVPLSSFKKYSITTQSAIDVKFSPDSAPVSGKVAHIAAVAEPGSQTLNVRIEVPNPAQRPAGEHVKVIFKAPDGAVAGSEPATKPSTQESKEKEQS